MAIIRPDIIVDDGAIIEQGYDIVRQRVSGWQPRGEGDFTAAIVEMNARLAADQRAVFASNIPDAALAGFGENVLNVLRDFGQAALSTLTFTLTGAAPTGGVLIPAGTSAFATKADGTTVAFSTLTDLTIPAASSSGTVVAAADTVGIVGNGLSGAGAMIDAVPLVASVSFAASTGGTDAESIDDYLTRVVQAAQLLGYCLALPADFETFAMLTEPEVWRAMAIDLYDSGTDTTPVARTLSLVIEAADGGNVSSPTKTRLAANIARRIGQNEVCILTDPLPSDVDVDVVLVKTASADATDVHDRVLAALDAYFDARTWGNPTNETDPTWRPRPIVYYNDAVYVVRSVPGVDHITTLTLNGGTSNVTLSSGKPHAVPNLAAGSTVTVT